MELSIVIPLYNAGWYIGMCVDSILQIKNIDFEAIVVDDGSTDGSAAIVQSYRDNRLRIIRQPNGGPSRARNRGLEEASGRYVAFIDADDFVDSVQYELFVKKVSEAEVDFGVGNGVYLFENGEKRVFERNSLREGVWKSGFELMRDMQKNRCFRTEVWNHLFRREFLLKDRLYFDENLAYEDVKFICESYMKAGKVMYLGHAFYDYRQHESGLSGVVASHKSDDYLKIIEILQEKIAKLDGGQKQIAARMIYDLFFDLLKTCPSQKIKTFSLKFKSFHKSHSDALRDKRDKLKSLMWVCFPKIFKRLKG